jgi:hypothetical protein
MRASIDLDKRWVTVAFTWNGLRALGLPEPSLATFPEDFQQGMVARRERCRAEHDGLSPVAGTCRRVSRLPERAPPHAGRAELVAAKLMAAGGATRRSCWHRTKTTPGLGSDPRRNNGFNYKQRDPLGYVVPFGAHIRR